MTPTERIEQLERQLQQTQEATEAMLVLLFGLATEDAWRKTITSPGEAADWLCCRSGSKRIRKTTLRHT